MNCLFILIFIIKINIFIGEQELCTDSLDIPHMVESFFCDQYLISTVQYQLESTRKLNKYLYHKLQENMRLKHEVCDIPQENQIDSSCPKRDVYASCINAVKSKGPGVYLIDPPFSKLNPFMVYCEEDPNGGPAWTVIQKRVDNMVLFQRKWDSYVNGFGDLYQNYWLGLNIIHELTSNHDFELWIELTSQNDIKKSARYNHFGIGGPHQYYNLQILGNYTGDIGDSLLGNQGLAFSTQDKKNEETASCATASEGGWWYGTNCGNSRLNAFYNSTTWSTWMKEKYGYKKVHMAIREISLTGSKCN